MRDAILDENSGIFQFKTDLKMDDNGLSESKNSVMMQGIQLQKEGESSRVDVMVKTCNV
jgi:hypothetical protein